MNYMWVIYIPFYFTLSSHAKSLQSCPTLCDPIDSSPPGSSIHGTLQARVVEWLALSFSDAWKEKWNWSHSVVSDSSRPHGLQPTRLLHPWDFPGDRTGVDCHINFFFQRLDGILSSCHIPFEWRLNCFIWCIPLVVHIFKVLLTTWEFDFSYLLHHWTI